MSPRIASTLQKNGLQGPAIDSLEKQDAVFVLTQGHLLYEDAQAQAAVSLQDLVRIHSGQDGVLRVETIKGTAIQAPLLGFEAGAVNKFFAAVRDITTVIKREALSAKRAAELANKAQAAQAKAQQAVQAQDLTEQESADSADEVHKPNQTGNAGATRAQHSEPDGSTQLTQPTSRASGLDQDPSPSSSRTSSQPSTVQPRITQPMRADNAGQTVRIRPLRGETSATGDDAASTGHVKVHRTGSLGGLLGSKGHEANTADSHSAPSQTQPVASNSHSDHASSASQSPTESGKKGGLFDNLPSWLPGVLGGRGHKDTKQSGTGHTKRTANNAASNASQVRSHSQVVVTSQEEPAIPDVASVESQVLAQQQQHMASLSGDPTGMLVRPNLAEMSAVSSSQTPESSAVSPSSSSVSPMPMPSVQTDEPASDERSQFFGEQGAGRARLLSHSSPEMLSSLQPNQQAQHNQPSQPSQASQTAAESQSTQSAIASLADRWRSSPAPSASSSASLDKVSVTSQLEQPVPASPPSYQTPQQDHIHNNEDYPAAFQTGSLVEGTMQQLSTQADSVGGLVTNLRVLSVVVFITAVVASVYLFMVPQMTAALLTIVLGVVSALLLWGVAEITRLLVLQAQAVSLMNAPFSGELADEE